MLTERQTQVLHLAELHSAVLNLTVRSAYDCHAYVDGEITSLPLEGAEGATKTPTGRIPHSADAAYVIVLHELAHRALGHRRVFGEYAQETRNEVEAWEWTIAYHLGPFTDDGKAVLRAALASYVDCSGHVPGSEDLLAFAGA